MTITETGRSEEPHHLSQRVRGELRVSRVAVDRTSREQLPGSRLVNWTQAGSMTVPMTTQVTVGLVANPTTTVCEDHGGSSWAWPSIEQQAAFLGGGLRRRYLRPRCTVPGVSTGAIPLNRPIMEITAIADGGRYVRLGRQHLLRGRRHVQGPFPRPEYSGIGHRRDGSGVRSLSFD